MGKGEKMKKTQERFKVIVKVEDGNNRGTKLVTIKGTSPNNVAAAVREMDIVSERFDISPESIAWVCGKGNRHTKLIRELTGVASLNLREERDGAGADDD